MIADAILTGVLLLTIFPLVRGRQMIAGTTLVQAWLAGAIAHGMWLLANLAQYHGETSPALLDRLWYAAAIVSLVPGIAALGARRPQTRVWATFILLPLIAVFAWPALTGWFQSGPLPRFELELPIVIGVGLVIVMGQGNYLATRFGVPSTLVALAILTIVAELGGFYEPFPWMMRHGRHVAPGLWCLSGILAYQVGAGQRVFAPWYDSIWCHFRDLYGIVWARRILERVNERAVVEQWDCHLEYDGFHWDAENAEATTEETERRMEHTLRWLLQRFVSDAWVNRHLEQTSDDVGRAAVDDREEPPTGGESTGDGKNHEAG